MICANKIGEFLKMLSCLARFRVLSYALFASQPYVGCNPEHCLILKLISVWGDSDLTCVRFGL